MKSEWDFLKIEYNIDLSKNKSGYKMEEGE